MKRVLLVIGVLLLLVGGVFFWRMTHPPLTDEQQIAANLDGIVAAADARSASGVSSFLSKNFQFNGIKKTDFKRQLVGGFLQFRVVDVKTSNVKVAVQGESATSTGNYNLSLKSEYNSPAQVYPGNFTLKWKKEEGQWKVVGIQGDILPQLAQ